MPTYSYACRVCGHRFESVQSIHDAALTTCPVCEGEIRRVISAAGVTFKGSGFYRTDSRSGAKPSTPSTSGTPTTSGTPATTPAKTENKPATSAAADPS